MVLTDTSKGKLYTDNTVESLFLETSVFCEIRDCSSQT